jgi:hypothetical protein
MEDNVDTSKEDTKWKEACYADVIRELREKYPIFHIHALTVYEEVAKHFPDEAEAFSSGGKISEETLHKITDTCRVGLSTSLRTTQPSETPNIWEEALMEATRAYLELVREKVISALLKADYLRDKLKKEGE